MEDLAGVLECISVQPLEKGGRGPLRIGGALRPVKTAGHGACVWFWDVLTNYIPKITGNFSPEGLEKKSCGLKA
jgi:hypothetical protein